MFLDDGLGTGECACVDGRFRLLASVGCLLGFLLQLCFSFGFIAICFKELLCCKYVAEVHYWSCIDVFIVHALLTLRKFIVTLRRLA